MNCPKCGSYKYEEYIYNAVELGLPVTCGSCGYEPNMMFRSDEQARIQQKIDAFKILIHQRRKSNWHPELYDQIIHFLKKNNIEYVEAAFSSGYDRFIRTSDNFLYKFDEHGDLISLKEDYQYELEEKL
jgi:predicted nucleic-acid-binding Zn-ribbon protein